VAREHDLVVNSVHDWVARAKTDEGNGPAGALTTSEREELQQLRRDNKRLQMERDILKKATAFFAKETT
jgi:transposase